MEPFFLRCETCQARLRVRDKRFLGQIQSCPKCGSMVHILAPAGWLAAEEAVTEAVPEIAEVAAASPQSLSASALDWIRGHALVTAAGATAVVVTCGFAAFLALQGAAEVAAVTPVTSAVSGKERAVAEPITEPIAADDSAPSYEEVESGPVDLEVPSSATETAESVATPNSSFLPLVSLDSVQAPTPEPEPKPEPARTLTLEPVENKPQVTQPANEDVSTTEYVTEIETEAAVEPPAAAAAQPKVEEVTSALDPPARRTNIADQLSVPIESIDLPEMPIGKFVQLMSDMADVPIELDPKVLGEVGLSSHSTVKVHDESTTVGKLLARVLKENQLTCKPGEGTLIVIRHKR